MKKKVILLLLALSVSGAHAQKIEGDRFQKLLKDRGIDVAAKTSIVTPKTGSLQLITIKNDLQNPLTYDPHKIAPHLEDNGDKFVKMIRLKRIVWGAGAAATLIGSVGLPSYMIKLNRELAQARQGLREQGKFNQNRGKTSQDIQREGVGRDLEAAGTPGLTKKIPETFFLGTVMGLSFMSLGFSGIFLLTGYAELSPKHIIQEKITIDPGQKVQVLLWFKSKEKCDFVDIEGKYKLICTSDAYQAMNKALEVE